MDPLLGVFDPIKKSIPDGFAWWIHRWFFRSISRGHHRLQTVWLGLARWESWLIQWQSWGKLGPEVDFRNVVCENMMKWNMWSICYVCLFENPVINPGGNLQFTYMPFSSRYKSTIAWRHLLRFPAAGFLGSRFLPSRQMKVECVKVSGERLELEIGEACFVSDLKVGRVRLTKISMGGWKNVGDTFFCLFLMTCPNLSGICLASTMSPNLKLWKKFKKFHWSPFPSVAAKSWSVWGGLSSHYLVSNIFFMFTPIWGRCPIWLIFFRWVETTNQQSSFSWIDFVVKL